MIFLIMKIKKNKTYIIAEIGINHEGSFKNAIKLIREAAKSGADAVKFQSIRFDRIYQTKYETISKNFTEVEFEKNSIFKQIQELNNSLNSTNLVDKSFSEENIEENSNRSQISKEISDDELDNNQKSPKSKNNLDTDITDIFN